MKSHIYIKIVSFLCMGVLLSGIFGLSGCSAQGVITLQKEIFKVQVGEPLDTQTGTYVKASKKMLEEMVLDLSGVDNQTIGQYSGSVRYRNYTAKFTISVTDLTAPEIVLKEATYYTVVGSTLKLSDVVLEVKDYSEVLYGFSEDMTLADDRKTLVEELYFPEKGTYLCEVLARDTFQNYAVESFHVEVVEDSELPSDVPTIVDYGIYMNSNEGKDVSDLYAFNSEGVYYGVGEGRDETTKRPDVVYYQNLYGDFTVDFIMPESKYIWLTFNEIIERGYTEQILDTLKEKNVSAVFFVTKYYVENNPDLVMRMIDEGHVLGNYTADGIDVPTLSVNDLTNEINSLYNCVHDKYGYDMYLFRTPSGYFSEQALAVAQNLGYRTVFWSFAYADWDVDNQPEVDVAYANAVDRLHGGAIYLLSGGSSTNAAMLGDLIDAAREQNFEFAVYQKNE